MILVLGRENSGKSVLAEKLAMETGDPVKIYLATMKICDDEGKKRVIKHRAQREGKGFITIEKCFAIDSLIGETKNPEQTTVLLECVANLVGNELFDHSGGIKPAAPGDLACEDFAEEIISEIQRLNDHFHHLILVSNTYEKKPDYDMQTRLYLSLLDQVNEKLLMLADQTIDLRKGTED
ncbi:MAG: bifunctional adenosylcobinamide kinase/adenosylcobinamide-phosphate guanylyltransferase [Lachnospiraceae bacterium]|nr:bifunctional adenosylcobinamide kinase/adenosylcobinamide-phosphate guanylyltransferase [Lachnospiraceae bacterium]